jgi:hypothetical protein
MRLIGAIRSRVDGRPIAVARMLLAFAMGICVAESTATLRGIASGKLRFPVLEVIPAPTSGWVQVYFTVGVAAAVLLLLGVAAGAAAAVGSTVLASALLWDQQTYSSHHLLVTLLLAYLAFARPGRRWSLAALRVSGAETVPWWPQLLMMTQVSVLYLFAAASKVNPRFLSGEPLRDWLSVELPIAAFQGLAVLTILTELLLAFGLWIPRVRVVAVIAGIGLHAGIVLGLGDPTLVLTAFAAASMSTYWLFLRRPALRRRVRRSPPLVPQTT